jgi:hypothetical protein
MGQALPVMADETLDTRVATDTPEAAPGRDLRSLVEAYERRLIVNALGAAGGRQNRAAALLGMLPTTLCEKMKRLGISLRAPSEPAAGPLPTVLAPDASDEFVWRGRLRPGATVEIKGQRGDVRAAPSSSDMVELVARKSGRSAATQLAINVLEHDGGAVFSVFTTHAAGPAGSTGYLSSKLRADFDLRLPAGIRLEVRLLAGSIEVIGLKTEVEASTVNGSVRIRGLPRRTAS